MMKSGSVFWYYRRKFVHFSLLLFCILSFAIGVEAKVKSLPEVQKGIEKKEQAAQNPDVVCKGSSCGDKFSYSRVGSAKTPTMYKPGTCEAEGMLSAVPALASCKTKFDVGGKKCYYNCTCPATHDWTGTGCSLRCPAANKYTCSGSNFVGGSGTACDGKYATCVCKPGYNWESYLGSYACIPCPSESCTTTATGMCGETSRPRTYVYTCSGGGTPGGTCYLGGAGCISPLTCISNTCACPSTYIYACTGTGYAAGVGTKCPANNKYTSCTCAVGYHWNGSACVACVVSTPCRRTANGLCGERMDYASWSGGCSGGGSPGVCYSGGTTCTSPQVCTSGVCQCPSSFFNPCTGTGYAAGSGISCGGKYSSCVCSAGYNWNGTACANCSTEICTTTATGKCGETSRARQYIGTCSGGGSPGGSCYSGGTTCVSPEFCSSGTCQCPSTYAYTCSGTGYAGGAGSNHCNYKYTSCNCSAGYTWSGGMCRLSCAVGDIMYSDFTCSETMNGKTPIGIVYKDKTSGSYYGKIISLDSWYGDWSMAKSKCSMCSTSGFSSWRLPSYYTATDELYTMATNYYWINTGLRNAGKSNMSSGAYWTDAYTSSTDAWIFSPGNSVNLTPANQSYSNNIVCIRDF